MLTSPPQYKESEAKNVALWVEPHNNDVQCPEIVITYNLVLYIPKF